MSTIDITIAGTKVTLPTIVDATFEVNGVKVTIAPATQQTPDETTPDEMVYSSEMCSQSFLFEQVVKGCTVEFEYIKDGERTARSLFVVKSTDTHIAGVEQDGSYKNFRRDRINYYHSVSIPN